MDNVEKIIGSRTEMCRQVPPLAQNTEEEGGCGVTGFICSIPVTGKNIFEPSVQMHNRGNGKGGGTKHITDFAPRGGALWNFCGT